MILALKNGQLIPPASPAEGHKRMRALVAECSRIEFQLRDAGRKRAFEEGKIPGDYLQWKHSAEQALRMHNLERRLLGAWLERQDEGLLKRASDILQALIADEVEFDETERALIDELAEYVRVREVR